MKFQNTLSLLGLIILLMALTFGITQSYAAQLIQNGGFEEGTGGIPAAWSCSAGTLARTSSVFRTGSFAGTFTSNSLTFKWLFQTIAIVPETKYSFSAYVLKNSPNVASVNLHILWYSNADGTGQELGDVDSQSLSDNKPDFRLLSISKVQAPPQARSAVVKIVLKPSSTGAGTVYVDDVTFTSEDISTSTPSSTSTATPSSTFTPLPTSSQISMQTTTATSTKTPSIASTPTIMSTPTAGPGDILINEVQARPDGIPETNLEWIELYNTRPVTVTLLYWRLADNDLTETLPPLIIPPGRYAVVAGKTESFANTFPGFDGILVQTWDNMLGNGLSNSADLVVLEDPDGRVIDAVSWGRGSSSWTNYSLSPWVDGVGPATTGKTIGRFPNVGDKDLPSDWQSNMPPSPGQANWIPSATSTTFPHQSRTPSATHTATTTPTATRTVGAKNVVLNEIFAAPHKIDSNSDGEANSDDEFIELFNLLNYPQDIGGLSLSDGSGKTFILPSDSIIEARGFKVVFGSETGLHLNNDSDSVTLSHPDGSIFDQYSYQRPHYDESFSRDPDGTGKWQRTIFPSPGEKNFVPTATPTPTATVELETTIIQAKQLPRNTHLVINSQVTTLPDILGSGRIYVQDQTSGIAVYLPKGNYPELSLGSWLKIKGRISEDRGEKQILVSRGSDILVLSQDQPPAPKQITLSEFGEQTEGELVFVEAELANKSGDRLNLKDNSGTGRALIRQQTGVNTESLKAGIQLRIVGIVSQYDNQTPQDEGYRLLPRRPEDIQPLSVNRQITTTNGTVVRMPAILPKAGEPSHVLIILAGFFSFGIGKCLKRYCDSRTYLN